MRTQRVTTSERVDDILDMIDIALGDKPAPLFEAIALLSYDPTTDTLTEVSK